MKNIQYLWVIFVFLVLEFSYTLGYTQQSQQPKVSHKPNVILIMTDDKGYGDIGALGNDIIETPHLDNFYQKSVRFTNFHVSPTCSPTRGALMTGRYTDRVGPWHTIEGRELLFSDEKILPQVFAENGYATGMFGKWHLGYAYPFRPEDRGFQQVVRNGGGGIGQGPDYWGNNRFDDTYWHNGKTQQYHGYSTDVFFNQAIQFIKNNKDRPFFVYLPTSSAHHPLNVPEKYYNSYKSEDRLSESLKRFYGMITNIDDNFKRLEDTLKQLHIDDNTILIFMTDNGTAEKGFNAGMRGRKGSPYEGGHRVPFFIRWPDGNIGGGKDISQLAAHIDVLPTLVELCDLHFVANKPLDGKSLAPVLKGSAPAWKNRTIIVDSQRMQNLVKWRKTAVMQNSWRLVNRTELYNISDDPGESKNISSKFPLVVSKLRARYDRFWQSLIDKGINQRYAYFKVGTPYENPVRISAHDMHTGLLGYAWNQRGALQADGSPGVLKVDFMTSGKYKITLRRYPRESGLWFNEEVSAGKDRVQIERPGPAAKQIHLTKATLVVAGVRETKPIKNQAGEVNFEVNIPAGKYDMQAILIDKQGRHYPSYYTYIEKL